MASFSRLAQVEVQLAMQHCDKVTLLRLARCSRMTLAAASHPFAWRSLPPLVLECDSPLELSSRVPMSLLRFADLSVSWDMQSQWGAIARGGAEGDADSLTEEQRDARTATEAAAVAALPGLRHLNVTGCPADVGPLCSALLEGLDDGGAPLTRLHIRVKYEEEEDGAARVQPEADYFMLDEFVQRSRTLTALHIGDQRWHPDGVRALADGVRQSQSLAVLHLYHCAVRDEGAAVALGVAVAHCRTLTDLQLVRCGIGDVGVEALAAALEQVSRSVRILDLSGNPIGPAGAASVARLLAADGCLIEQFDLAFHKVNDAGVQSLAKALRTNCTLTQLRLEYCSIGKEGTAALAAALQVNPHIPLRHLNLSTNEVDAAGAVALAGFLGINSTLEVLNLRNCRLNDAAVVALATGLPSSHSLRELWLRSSTAGGKCVNALAAGIGACPTLALLEIDIAQIGDGGMATLALTNVHSFYASGCGLTGGSAASLVLLVQPGCQLHTLCLEWNALGTPCVVALAAALQSSSPLRTLNLRNCGIDAEGAAALGEALLRGWSVTDLQLDGNPLIGDDGARSMAAALEQSAGGCSLHELSLCQCGLTAAGALSLIRASAVLPSLGRLLLMSKAILYEDRPALIAACGAHFKLLL